MAEAFRACGYQVDGAQSAVTIDPMMHSYSDGIIQWNDGPALLSVKTIGYKKSGKQGSKWVRQGFPALPFDGVYAGQPSWWAQAQAEMHGSGIHETLVLAVAKDIVAGKPVSLVWMHIDNPRAAINSHTG